MSLNLVRAVAHIESSDDLHVARMLLLLAAVDGKKCKPIDGIMKLAKLDFLLRYPNCLERALYAIGKDPNTANIQNYERNTIEAKMIRFRFGPWDSRYRRWIGLLVAKGLGRTYLKGRTVYIELTNCGLELAASIEEMVEFRGLADRSKLVSKMFDPYSGTKLKNFIYKVFPEIADLKWGERIEI